MRSPQALALQNLGVPRSAYSPRRLSQSRYSESAFARSGSAGVVSGCRPRRRRPSRTMASMSTVGHFSCAEAAGLARDRQAGRCSTALRQ